MGITDTGISRRKFMQGSMAVAAGAAALSAFGCAPNAEVKKTDKTEAVNRKKAERGLTQLAGTIAAAVA